MQRFSKKRQSILDCLRSTKEHPSAEWVYERLKPLYPDLSIATVYRNLNQLKADGQIRSVGIVLGKERFDAATVPHIHAICSVCGKVIDVENLEIPESVAGKAAESTGFTLFSSEIRFSGICPDCKKKQQNNGQ